MPLCVDLGGRRIIKKVLLELRVEQPDPPTKHPDTEWSVSTTATADTQTSTAANFFQAEAGIRDSPE
eukprot:COSAG05_NODE_23465_length_258_cov_0.522013_1_plen_67_part_00